VPDPQDPATFERSKLRWTEIAEPGHAGVFALYRACLRERAAWLAHATDRGFWTVRALGTAVALRFRPPGDPERLFVAALRGSEPLPWEREPFLQPPPGAVWRQVLHSNPDGSGTGPTPFAVLLAASPL